MKAAVWTDINKIEVMDVEKPKPQKGQVIIKVKGAGVCTTDIHIMSGLLKLAKPPHILGHEITGVIDELGEGVQGWAHGDRVVVDTTISCGECTFCQSGQREFCINGAEVGYPPYNGGYAEYVAVPAQGLHKLPDALSFLEGAIIESTICPSGSIMRYGVKMGETVFIQGGGVAGLAYIQIAKCCGAGKVIVSARGKRIDIAKQLGADVVIDAKTEDVYERVMEETNNQGATLSIEAAGVKETIDLAIKCCSNGGRVILYGIPSDNTKIEFPILDIIIKQLKIYGACGNPSAWEPVIALAKDGRFNLKTLVTHTYSLDEINEAVASTVARKDGLIKAVIVF